MPSNPVPCDSQTRGPLRALGPFSKGHTHARQGDREDATNLKCVWPRWSSKADSNHRTRVKRIIRRAINSATGERVRRNTLAYGTARSIDESALMACRYLIDMARHDRLREAAFLSSDDCWRSHPSMAELSSAYLASSDDLGSTQTAYKRPYR